MGKSVCKNLLKLNSSLSIEFKAKIGPGKIDHSDEVLLIMDSVEENFSKIEAEVKKLHSYDVFVLISVPVSQTTKKVENWIKAEIKSVIIKP